MSQLKPRSIVEKLWDSHVVSQKEGHPAIFAIDLMLVHEVTSAQAFALLEERKFPVFDTGRIVATLDHSIPTRINRFEIFDQSAKNQVETLRSNAKKFDISIYDFESGNQGIVHVIGPELGYTQPGMTIVCGDSHTSTHGAFGALAFGIGTSEVGHVLATGCLLQDKPKTMKVEFKGKMPEGVYSKDLVLKLIADIGIGGANGHIIEYCGDAVSAMSMEERLTICNMSIECGARAGLMSPDDITVSYLKGRKFAPKDSDWERAVAYWKSFASDEGCSYDKEIVIDVSKMRPMITWGTNPEQAIYIDEKVPTIKTMPVSHQETAAKALQYVALDEGSAISGVKVDWAFLGSCTNGRIEDLRVAAKLLQNRRVADGVTLFIVPGSEAVAAQAVKEGLFQIFELAGATVRKPGCSMCLGMNDDKVPPGARCISSSNRNFVGRQGPGSRTHLASPATVVASAIAGKITSPLELE